MTKDLPEFRQMTRCLAELLDRREAQCTEVMLDLSHRVTHVATTTQEAIQALRTLVDRSTTRIEELTNQLADHQHMQNHERTYTDGPSWLELPES